MSKLSNVWVFSDIESRLPEVIAGGLQLGDKVSAFILGTPGDIKTAYELGASTVYALGQKVADRIIEDYAGSLARIIAGSRQPTLVLLPATRRSKALAARLGAMLNAGVCNDASEITLTDGVIFAKHMVYGGLAFSEEKIISSIAIVSVSNGVFDVAPADMTRTGQAIETDFVAPKSAIRCVERRAKQNNSADLGKARRVVSVGRGIANKENIQLAAELSHAIGAELGCSRPVAENEKWMARERYIGISGTTIKPELYLAMGISGQIQHMVGVNGAQTIFAINNDKNAPIFRYADYGIVGDLFNIVPALIDRFKK